MFKRIGIALAVAFAATTALAATHGSAHGGGGHGGGGGGHWGGGGHYGGGGHAVPRGSGGYGHGSGAYAGHPRAGTGHGYYYGHGHGYYGHSHYGYGHSHYPYYGYYPYSGYYPYYGYGYGPYWGGFGLSFSYNAGPSYEVPPSEADDDRGGDDPAEGYSDQGQASDANREPATEVRLRVRPEDAAVYLDGELRGPAGRVANLHVSAGHHRLEFVRPGYRPAERDVTVGHGESVPLNVDLER